MADAAKLRAALAASLLDVQPRPPSPLVGPSAAENALITEPVVQTGNDDLQMLDLHRTMGTAPQQQPANAAGVLNLDHQYQLLGQPQPANADWQLMGAYQQQQLPPTMGGRPAPMIRNGAPFASPVGQHVPTYPSYLQLLQQWVQQPANQINGAIAAAGTQTKAAAKTGASKPPPKKKASKPAAKKKAGKPPAKKGRGGKAAKVSPGSAPPKKAGKKVGPKATNAVKVASSKPKAPAKKAKKAAAKEAAAKDEQKPAAQTLRGVTQKPSGKWQAQIHHVGKSRYLGCFQSKEAAAMGYEVARELLQNAGGSGGTDEEREAEAKRSMGLAQKAAKKAVEESGK